MRVTGFIARKVLEKLTFASLLANVLVFLILGT